MSALPAASPAAFPPAAGSDLLGEVICWACPGVAVRHADLVAALDGSGLDPAVARELAPRHAFSRACKRLGERRIIRPVAETRESVQFQFTAESRAGDKYDYVLETMLTLDKKSGLVTCDLPGLATLAQEELDRCVEARTGSDVTRVVQKLFERQADLFPVRPSGGVYFVPDRHSAFTGKVQQFLGRVNGRLLRFPVPAGTAEGDRSVRESVAAGLSAVVEEHRRAVAAFGEDTREATIERAAERIRASQFKVEAYAELLADRRDALLRELAAARRELRAKVESLAAVPAVA